MEKLEMMLRLMELHKWGLESILDLKDFLRAKDTQFKIILSRPIEEIIKHPWHPIQGYEDTIRLLIKGGESDSLLIECPRPYWWQWKQKDFHIRKRIYERYFTLWEAAKMLAVMEQEARERALVSSVLAEATNVQH